VDVLERISPIHKADRIVAPLFVVHGANDPRVPKDVQTEFRKWGLAKDEFRDNGGWPHQLYIREARRMVGAFVMTENELQKRKPTPEPIGMGSYTIDSHNVQRYITPEGYVQNEGDIGVSFEFFPPKTEKMEAQLWDTFRTLEPLGIGLHGGRGFITRAQEVDQFLDRQAKELRQARLEPGFRGGLALFPATDGSGRDSEEFGQALLRIPHSLAAGGQPFPRRRHRSRLAYERTCLSARREA